MYEGAITEYSIKTNKSLGITIESYLMNDFLHRENAPALLEYIKHNGKDVLILESYYQHGMKHREDGPAQIFYDYFGINLFKTN